MGSLGKPLQVLLVGSGGIGTMVAYALKTGGQAEVTAVLRSNYDAVKENYFHIHSVDHGEVVQWCPTKVLNNIPSIDKDSPGTLYDYVVVATKNFPGIQEPSLPELIAPAIAPGYTAIVLIQNGLNIERPFFAKFPMNPILSGITFMGAAETSPGIINHYNHDRTLIGVFPNHSASNYQESLATAAARCLVDAYSACGSQVDCTYEPNVPYSRWRKLLYNASYNGVAAILGMDTSRMRFSEHIIDSLIRPLMQEIRAIAKGAANVDLEEELIEKMIVVDDYEKFFKPSMLQDAEKGRFLEFENLVGEPLREAEKAKVKTPTLKFVYCLLKGLQFKAMEKHGYVVVPKTGEGLPYGGC